MQLRKKTLFRWSDYTLEYILTKMKVTFNFNSIKKHTSKTNQKQIKNQNKPILRKAALQRVFAHQPLALRAGL